MSNSFQPQGLHAACQPTLCFTVPEVCSGSCPLSQWCYLSCPQVLSSSPPAFNLFQHQGPFQWVSSSHQVAKELELQLQQWLSHEYSRLISFGIDWFDLLAVQETLKSLLQHHNLKASVLQFLVFFMVQLSHPYMTSEKNKFRVSPNAIFLRSWVRMYSSKRVLN